MPFGASFFPFIVLSSIDKEEKMQRLETVAATLTLAVVLSFLLVSAEQAVPAWAADNNSQKDITIVEPGRTLFGKSYNQLAGELSNWLVAEPEATNVASDPDGRFCHLNQEGKVWFLAGTWDPGITQRTCKVPAGKAIFFALDSWISFPPEFPEEGDPCADLPTLVEQIRCDVNEDLDVAPYLSLEVTIDGETIEDLFAYRAQSQPGGFIFRIPEGSLLNEWGFTPGDRFPAVVDGYWILLKPMPPGSHTIKVVTTYPDGSSFGVNYTLLIPKRGRN